MQRFILAVCLLTLAGCSNPVTAIPTVVGPKVTPDLLALPTLTPFEPQATPVPSSTATANAIPTIAPAILNTSRPLITIKGTLDYGNHSLSADESILYPNRTGVTLDLLVLAVEPNLWAGCFDMSSLLVGDQAPGGVTLTGDRMEIPLSDPLVPGEVRTISLHFNLTLPGADSSQVFGYNDRQLNLVDWYPFVVPYAGTWIMHASEGIGEHLVYEENDFNVTLNLGGKMQALTLAASAAGDLLDGNWHYSVQGKRNFVISASPMYQVTTTSAGGLTINGYYFSEEAGAARFALQEVARAVSTFSALFDPLTPSTLSIVESPFFDGMEYDGLFFLSRNFYTADDGTVLNNLVDIAVHETAHQWWYGSVGNDQALEPWLDEALATYSERLFYQQNYPKVNAWWAFRVDAYSPSGWVDTDIYHGVDFRTYANAVYLRGAQFLEVLRNRMGDVDFFAFLKDYRLQMAGRISTGDDFFKILRQHTSLDITDIQRTFFQEVH